MAKMAARPLPLREVTCVGGPWHGLEIQTRVPHDGFTLAIKVKSDPRIHNVGRYKMGAWQAFWEPANV